MIPRKTVYLGSAVHGLWMVALSLLLLTKGCATGDEVLLVRLASLVRQASTDTEQVERLRDQFLFVDVAHELQLVDKTDTLGMPIGKQAIVDRAKLTELFRILGRTDVHRFVLCDVFFAAPSPHDAALREAAAQVRNVRFPSFTDAEGRLEPLTPALRDLPTGLAQYDLHGGAFLKFSLVQQDSLASIPLQMHRTLHPDREVTGFNRLNTFIPDLQLPEAAIRPIYLSDLLRFSDDVVAQNFLNDRIVLIGDFSSPADQHDTTLGPMPGPLILANTYLALSAGDNRVQLRLLLYLWVTFSLLSFWHATRFEALHHALPSVSLPWRLRRHESRLGRLIPLLMGHRQSKLWWRGLCNLFALALISGVAYLLFGMHLHVLYLVVYLGTAGALLNDYLAPTHSWWEQITSSPPPTAESDPKDASPPTIQHDRPPAPLSAEQVWRPAG